MAKGSDLPMQSLSAGFPVKEKAPIDLSGKGWVGPRGTAVYTYWTNFTRNNSDEFKIVLGLVRPHKDFWCFRTNLPPEDLVEGKMQSKDVRRFMYKMFDIYRVPEE